MPLRDIASRKHVNRWSSQPGTLAELGPLEQKIVGAIWAQGEITIRELLEHNNLNVAYTTVMATVNRLCRKHVLTRMAMGRAFRYKARFTREEMQRAEAVQLISRWLRSGPSVKLQLSFLVEALAERDAHLLEELWCIVAEKRHQLGKHLFTPQR